MEERRIVWDEVKNVENKRKHGIGFETARFVFADPERLFRLDRSAGNTLGEERWQSSAWPKVWFLRCMRRAKQRERTRRV
ncbi:MAG: BrnT family toxin [Treponema sp.]|nr:BrnT family toxin [Treponema sp.]